MRISEILDKRPGKTQYNLPQSIVVSIKDRVYERIQNLRGVETIRKQKVKKIELPDVKAKLVAFIWRRQLIRHFKHWKIATFRQIRRA